MILRVPQVIWPGVAAAVGYVAVSVMLLAGAAKLLDVTAFESVLRTWSLVPAVVVPALAIGVPALEILLSVWWFTAVRRGLAGVAIILLLLCFTAAFGLQASLASPPECGCFGAIGVFKAGQQQAVYLVLRNGVLAVAVAGGTMSLGIRRSRLNTERSQ